MTFNIPSGRITVHNLKWTATQDIERQLTTYKGLIGEDASSDT
jgi:hypothetical protein